MVEDRATRPPELATAELDRKIADKVFRGSPTAVGCSGAPVLSKEDEREVWGSPMVTGGGGAHPSSGSNRNSSRYCCHRFFSRMLVAGARQLSGEGVEGLEEGEGE